MDPEFIPEIIQKNNEAKEKLPDDKVSLLSDTDNRDIEGGNGEGKSSVGNNPNAYSDNPMNNADDNSAIMLEMSMSTPIQASNKSEDKTDLLDFEVEVLYISIAYTFFLSNCFTLSKI